MRCAEAHKQMHELLSGVLDARGALDSHLAECAECAGRYRALESVSQAAVCLANGPADEAALDRVSAGFRSKLATPAPLAGSRRLPRFALAGVASIALFAAGLATGRATPVPRAPVTQVVEKPVVVERTVEVPKPVVEERVVYKEVPVVRTRTVYRDRPVKALAEVPHRAQYAVANATPPESVNDPIAVGVIVSQTLRPVRVAPEPSAEPGTPPA
jgi:hypothetical protein